MTTTSTFTAIKLCLVVFTAISSVACGSTATSTPASPANADDAYAYVEEPFSASAHEMEVTFNEAPETARATEEDESSAHEPPPTVGMNDVLPTSAHSLTALR